MDNTTTRYRLMLNILVSMTNKHSIIPMGRDDDDCFVERCGKSTEEEYINIVNMFVLHMHMFVHLFACLSAESGDPKIYILR